jgi:hypothetical protein
MTSAAMQLVHEAPTGKGPGEPSRILAIAAELTAKSERIDTFTGPCADEDRLQGEVVDLIDELAATRPRNAPEALVTAAVAAAMARDIDGRGDPQHQRVLTIIANLVDYMQAAAGVTAAELGLAPYADGRHDAPPPEDDDKELVQMGYEAGFLAAVRRFAPTSYQFLRAEFERARAAGTEVRS